MRRMRETGPLPERGRRRQRRERARAGIRSQGVFASVDELQFDQAGKRADDFIASQREHAGEEIDAETLAKD